MAKAKAAAGEEATPAEEAISSTGGGCRISASDALLNKWLDSLGTENSAESHAAAADRQQSGFKRT